MRATTPTLHCDADDGACDNWDVDFYETSASAVGGVRITAERRAPGWTSTTTEDLCSLHAPKKDN
jgi:hypothetical protein